MKYNGKAKVVPVRTEAKGKEKEHASKTNFLAFPLIVSFVRKYIKKGVKEEIPIKTIFIVKVVDNPVIKENVDKKMCIPGVPEYSFE
jgi:hypothetical protein